MSADQELDSNRVSTYPEGDEESGTAIATTLQSKLSCPRSLLGDVAWVQSNDLLAFVNQNARGRYAENYLQPYTNQSASPPAIGDVVVPRLKLSQFSPNINQFEKVEGVDQTDLFTANNTIRRFQLDVYPDVTLTHSTPRYSIYRQTRDDIQQSESKQEYNFLYKRAVQQQRVFFNVDSGLYFAQNLYRRAVEPTVVVEIPDPPAEQEIAIGLIQATSWQQSIVPSPESSIFLANEAKEEFLALQADGKVQVPGSLLIVKYYQGTGFQLNTDPGTGQLSVIGTTINDLTQTVSNVSVAVDTEVTTDTLEDFGGIGGIRIGVEGLLADYALSNPDEERRAVLFYRGTVDGGGGITTSDGDESVAYTRKFLARPGLTAAQSKLYVPGDPESYFELDPAQGEPELSDVTRRYETVLNNCGLSLINEDDQIDPAKCTQADIDQLVETASELRTVQSFGTFNNAWKALVDGYINFRDQLEYIDTLGELDQVNKAAFAQNDTFYSLFGDVGSDLRASRNSLLAANFGSVTKQGYFINNTNIRLREEESPSRVPYKETFDRLSDNAALQELLKDPVVALMSNPATGLAKDPDYIGLDREVELKSYSSNSTVEPDVPGKSFLMSSQVLEFRGRVDFGTADATDVYSEYFKDNGGFLDPQTGVELFNESLEQQWRDLGDSGEPLTRDTKFPQLTARITFTMSKPNLETLLGELTAQDRPTPAPQAVIDLVQSMLDEFGHNDEDPGPNDPNDDDPNNDPNDPNDPDNDPNDPDNDPNDPDNDPNDPDNDPEPEDPDGQDPDSDGGLSTGAWVAVAAGAAVFLTLVILIPILVVRRKRRQRREQ